MGEVFKTVSWSAGPGCHGGCGQKLYVEDGKLVRVEGDEDNPWNQGRSCPRVLALKQYMYHPDRITTPLKRVGARGEGKFEPISLGRGLRHLRARLQGDPRQHGAESVIFVQGTGRDIGGPITMLAYSFGSPELGAARPVRPFLLHAAPRRHEDDDGRFRRRRLLAVPGEALRRSANGRCPR